MNDNYVMSLVVHNYLVIMIIGLYRPTIAQYTEIASELNLRADVLPVLYLNALMESSHVLWVKGQLRQSRGCVHLKNQVKRTTRGQDTA